MLNHKKIKIFLVVLVMTLSSSFVTVCAATYLWPAPGISYISCYYGENGHKGIDIAANGDHDIVAAREGTVIAAASKSCTHTNNLGDSCNYGMGNYVQIKHSDGTYATYMHMRYGSITVSVGQTVSRGTKIGMMGSSGNSSGQHLHFQLGYSSSNTINVNPDSLGYDYNNSGPPSAPTNCFSESWSDRVQIQWKTVSNADYYECGLIDINTRKTVVKANVNDWYYNFYNVPEGQYWAYVCAHNSAGTSSHSNWYRVDVGYPVPEAPYIWPNTEKTTEKYYIEVSWNAVYNATKYEYYVAELPGGYAYTTNTRHGFVTENSVALTGLKNGHYIMFVHAITALGKWSEQSNWISFDIYADDYVPSKIISKDNHIYALYDYEMAWDFARDLCTDLGGHLVTITSDKENEVICELIPYGSKDKYWIGAADYGRNDKDFAWVTGETFSYSNWAEGQPDSSGIDGEKEHFAEIRKSYGNKWNDVSNINKTDKGFILEIDTTDITPIATELFNGNTYMLFDRNTTWTEAEAYCEFLGGHLATANSSAENDFLKDFLQYGNRAWYFLGAKMANGSWEWIDGNTFKDISWREDAQNWSGNYLMMYKSSGNCVGLNNTYFPASDIRHMGFVCEIEQEPDLPINSNVSAKVTTEGLSVVNSSVATLENLTTRNIDCNVIFVYKYANGEVANIDIKNLQISGKQLLSVQSAISNRIIDLGSNLIDSVELYIWSSMDSMMPLAPKSMGEFVY
ncbi:MAG: peptidoglycan DD-metalloendopeptidase family protein [Oscillospiraceae bacterium]|nr:peptidoglycan DD-metalloendopeptidase family protein [Oscillospiraceae bacterium]